MSEPELTALRRALAAAETREDAIEAVVGFLHGLGLTVDELALLSLMPKKSGKAGRPPTAPEHDFLIALEAERILRSSPDTTDERAIRIASGSVACHLGFPASMGVPKDVDIERVGIDVLRDDVDFSAVKKRVKEVMVKRADEIEAHLAGSIFIPGSRLTKPGRGRPRKARKPI